MDRRLQQIVLAPPTTLDSQKAPHNSMIIDKLQRIFGSSSHPLQIQKESFENASRLKRSRFQLSKDLLPPIQKHRMPSISPKQSPERKTIVNVNSAESLENTKLTQSQTYLPRALQLKNYRFVHKSSDSLKSLQEFPIDEFQYQPTDMNFKFIRRKHSIDIIKVKKHFQEMPKPVKRSLKLSINLDVQKSAPLILSPKSKGPKVSQEQRFAQLMNQSLDSQFETIQEKFQQLERQSSIAKEIRKNPRAYFLKEQREQLKKDKNVKFALPKLA